MALRTAVAVLDGIGLRFEILTGSNHRFVVDDALGDTAPRPIEVALGAIATCTAMDVASILRKKRQVFDRYEVRAAGEQRAKDPHGYETIDLVHVFVGEHLDADAVRRAIELSATRYCSVGANLASGMAQVRHSFLIRDRDADETFGNVVVIGPYETPESLSARADPSASVPGVG
jgi:putative redox protein